MTDFEELTAARERAERGIAPPPADSRQCRWLPQCPLKHWTVTHETRRTRKDQSP